MRDKSCHAGKSKPAADKEWLATRRESKAGSSEPRPSKDADSRAAKAGSRCDFVCVSVCLACRRNGRLCLQVTTFCLPAAISLTLLVSLCVLNFDSFLPLLDVLPAQKLDTMASAPLSPPGAPLFCLAASMALPGLSLPCRPRRGAAQSSCHPSRNVLVAGLMLVLALGLGLTSCARPA